MSRWVQLQRCNRRNRVLHDAVRPHWIFEALIPTSQVPTFLGLQGAMMNAHMPRYDRPARTTASSLYYTSSAISEADIIPENDATIHEREDADSLDEVIMAVDMRNGGDVGCSFYVAKEEKLALLSDVRGGGLQIIDARMERLLAKLSCD